MSSRCLQVAVPVALAAALLPPAAVRAQPVDLPIPAATTSEYPAGIAVRQTSSGPVYVDARGRTLYGMDMRTLVRWSPDPSQYCREACAETWEPVLAPADAKPNIRFPQGFGQQQRAQAAAAGAASGAAAGVPRAASATAPQPPRPGTAPSPADGEFIQNQRAPDWTIINGPQGPQWVYKGWHVVYTRKGDKPGSTAFDGADEKTWNTLKFVPPVPRIAAPGGIAPVFVDGAYVLADAEGRVLFTGRCTADCAWKPMTGGMASRATGDWVVDRGGDRPQWTYKGKPVFISQQDDPKTAPARGAILKP